MPRDPLWRAVQLASGLDAAVAPSRPPLRLVVPMTPAEQALAFAEGGEVMRSFSLQWPQPPGWISASTAHPQAGPAPAAEQGP